MTYKCALYFIVFKIVNIIIAVYQCKLTTYLKENSHTVFVEDWLKVYFIKDIRLIYIERVNQK